MLENHLKKSYFLVLGEIGYCFSFYFLHIINWDVGVQLLVLISVKPPKLWSWICKKARNQRRRWVTRAWEVMPSQSLVIGFYLGMRSHMILVVIPHDKQRYLYSSFCFQNLFFMHDLSNFVTSITEVKITPCFYFKQKPRKNLHLIITKLFRLKLFLNFFNFNFVFPSKARLGKMLGYFYDFLWENGVCIPV